MKTSRFSDGQIIAVLKQAERNRLASRHQSYSVGERFTIGLASDRPMSYLVELKISCLAAPTTNSELVTR